MSYSSLAIKLFFSIAKIGDRGEKMTAVSHKSKGRQTVCQILLKPTTQTEEIYFVQFSISKPAILPNSLSLLEI